MWQSTHSEDAVRRRDPARELRVDVPRVEGEYANVLALETLLECVRVENVGEFAGAPGVNDRFDRTKVARAGDSPKPIPLPGVAQRLVNSLLGGEVGLWAEVVS